MGAGYSATTLKTNLKMCSSRMLMHRNKKSNASTVESKQVAVLMQQGKDESARIRVEMILHERNLASAMEILTLMCDLLHARVALITNSKTCPSDLEEGIATIIYCANRVEIPELKNISEQFASKYTKEWVMNHVDNQSGKVNSRVIDKLSIQPPPFDLILNTLHEIAATYNIEWKPDMDALEAGIVDASNPERLGSIAKIDLASQPGQQPANGGVQPIAVPNAGGNPQYPSMLAQPPSANQRNNNNQTNNNQVRQQFSPDPNIHLPTSVSSNSSQSSFPQYPVANINLSAPVFDQSGTSPGSPSLYPGSLNIIVHRARNVINLSSQSDPHDLYIRISNRQTGASWHSEADPVGGAEPIWMNNPNLPSGSLHHFSVAIADPTVQIQIEIMQKNTGTIKLKEDKVLGNATFYADNLRASPQLQWYGMYAQSMCIGYVLFSTQYIPTNAVVLSKEELDRQQHIQIMQQQQQQTQQGFQQLQPQLSPNGYNSSPPGGPTQQTTTISSSVTSYEYGTASLSPPQQPASYDYSQGQSSGVGESQMPNAPYQPLADAPVQQPQQFREEKSNYDTPQGEAGDDSSAILDAMPDVPKRDLTKKRGSGSSGSHGGGGSAGGGTLYAPPPAAKKTAKQDEDDLAERFRRLQ